MNITIFNEQKKKKINKQKISLFIKKILNYFKVPPKTQIGVLLVNNEKIHVLNKKYRKLDRPTDVLAFAMREGKGPVNPEILGDIVISAEQADIQASLYNHNFHEEFELLIVHGILHLLGYDHLKKKDAIKMQSLEQELLNKFGMKAPK